MTTAKALAIAAILLSLPVGSVWVANAQQAQPKPLPEGYVPDLAKPDRANKDVQANAQFLADPEKIRNDAHGPPMQT